MGGLISEGRRFDIWLLFNAIAGRSFLWRCRQIEFLSNSIMAFFFSQLYLSTFKSHSFEWWIFIMLILVASLHGIFLFACTLMVFLRSFNIYYWFVVTFELTRLKLIFNFIVRGLCRQIEWLSNSGRPFALLFFWILLFLFLYFMVECISLCENVFVKMALVYYVGNPWLVAHSLSFHSMMHWFNNVARVTIGPLEIPSNCFM